MTLSRNGTLEKALSQQLSADVVDSELTRLHHANSISSAAVSPVPAPAVVVPPPYSVAGSTSADPPLELRGSLDCWACSVLVTVQNLIIATINAGLAGVIFGLILTPALVMVVFGFLCHSSVQPHGTSVYCSDLLNDAACVALLVVGFLLLVPLLVLALAAYCRLARHLQLGLCFIPQGWKYSPGLSESEQKLDTTHLTGSSTDPAVQPSSWGRRCCSVFPGINAVKARAPAGFALRRPFPPARYSLSSLPPSRGRATVREAEHGPFTFHTRPGSPIGTRWTEILSTPPADLWAHFPEFPTLRIAALSWLGSNVSIFSLSDLLPFSLSYLWQ
ncbi:hypothetical protein SRHO_G00213000 [Serrasalmus rhombeus]